MSLSAAARKQRDHRARVKAGRRCYLLELPVAELELMLQVAGLLDRNTDDPREVEKALQRFLELTIDQVTSNDAL